MLFKQNRNRHVALCWARASAILNSSSRSSTAACWSSSLGRVALRWPPACSSTLLSLTTTDTSPFAPAELREEGEHSEPQKLTDFNSWRQSNKTHQRSARCWLTSVLALNPLETLRWISVSRTDGCGYNWELQQQFIYWLTASNAPRLTDCCRLPSACSVLQTLTTSVTLHTSNKSLMLTTGINTIHLLLLRLLCHILNPLWSNSGKVILLFYCALRPADVLLASCTPSITVITEHNNCGKNSWR